MYMTSHNMLEILIRYLNLPAKFGCAVACSVVQVGLNRRGNRHRNSRPLESECRNLGHTMRLETMSLALASKRKVAPAAVLGRVHRPRECSILVAKRKGVMILFPTR